MCQSQPISQLCELQESPKNIGSVGIGNKWKGSQTGGLTALLQLTGSVAMSSPGRSVLELGGLCGWVEFVSSEVTSMIAFFTSALDI